AGLAIRAYQLDHTFISSDNVMLAERIVKKQGFLWMLMEQYGLLISLTVKFFSAVIALCGITVTEFWWTLPIAITGTLCIPLAYLFLKRIGVSSAVSVIGALMIAVLPVHVFQSRYLWGYEVFGAMFLTIALWSLFNFYDDMSRKTAVTASALCGIYIISHGYFAPFAIVLLCITFIYSPVSGNFLHRIIPGLALYFKNYLWVGMALLLPLTTRPLIHMFAKKTKPGFYLFDHLPDFLTCTGLLIALLMLLALIIYALNRPARTKPATVLLLTGFLFMCPIIFATPPAITVIRGYMLVSTVFFLYFALLIIDSFFRQNRSVLYAILIVIAAVTLWGDIKVIFMRNTGITPPFISQSRGEIYDPGTKAAGYLVQKYIPASSAILAMHQKIEEPNIYYYFRRKDYAWDDLTLDQTIKKLNELKNVVDVVICSEEQKEAVAATGIFQKKVAMTDRQGGNAIYIFARKTIPLPDINSTFDEYNMLFDSEYSWNKEILSGFFAQHNKSFGQIVEESYKKPEHKERVRKYFRFLY
ncbi:MAG: hypothetical protein GX640_13085, partial [Fibrobacter sp.]|nr:hypothetical protein [Fibrobacter sp.]